MIYLIYHNNQLYRGGTAKGRQFISENMDISRRFSLSVHSEGNIHKYIPNGYCSSYAYIYSNYVHMYLYTYITFLFIVETHEPASEVKADKAILRMAVQSLLNAKYGMVIHLWCNIASNFL